MSSEEITPFRVDIPQAEIDRLYTRLLTKDIRHPTTDVVPNTGDDYGLPTQWAQDLTQYWLNDFSWTQAQEKLNQFPHFKTHIEGLDIHFIHQRSPNPNAIPILLLHGWPGSFHEFSEVIPPLCEGNNTDGPSFHCIVPSLPGFCFSSPPARRGWTVKDTARVFHTLMQRLGYSAYAVQAGDWGQFVARELAANRAYACKVLHLNYCPGALPEHLTDSDLTEREKGARAKGVDWRTNHVGYAVLMRTRPQTLGWMLQDNPIGLLAFVGEKYHEASNPAIHNSPKWKEHILTTVCLYYFTDCIASSGLIYYENVPHHLFAQYATEEANRIKCPFGYTSLWYDTAPNSRRAVERTGKLVWYKERDYAGHFACLEDPVGMVEDVKEVVGKHWEK
ncbi:Alpha/Beta hydrolase protein [Neohortaea acidophila]|uniref:Alpha/Beta hydrolase protein n=1 Tax=Neohortaea acidophila TaxID=245834 RepID=A0A6A6Q204_9PEZI|nr:Alpha/Beta hydrolase protein [Neohortaea acidophila]KAF2486016.1 Alpha/Beta hydrolase protein [Neohortaea acidophila]